MAWNRQDKIMVDFIELVVLHSCRLFLLVLLPFGLTLWSWLVTRLLSYLLRSTVVPKLSHWLRRDASPLCPATYCYLLLYTTTTLPYWGPAARRALPSPSSLYILYSCTYVVLRELKVGSHDASSRISWYKILYQGTEHSTGISFSFFLDLSSDFIAM